MNDQKIRFDIRPVRIEQRNFRRGNGRVSEFRNCKINPNGTEECTPWTESGELTNYYEIYELPELSSWAKFKRWCRLWGRL